MKYLQRRKRQTPELIQEEAGIRLGISHDLASTATHSANVMRDQYLSWLHRDRHAAWGYYKRNYFTIAVGGGNTVKAIYRAWLEHHHTDIDWIKHIRFFLLEDSTGEAGWESAQASLVRNFVAPLAHALLKRRGKNTVAKSLGLPGRPDTEEIIESMIAKMVNPVALGPARRALT